MSEEHWRDHHDTTPDIRDDEYTVDELAALLGVPRELILHEVEVRNLKADRAGGHTICIKREDALAWMQQRGGV